MTYKHNKKWRLSHTKRRNEGRKKYYSQFREIKRRYRRWGIVDSDLIIMSMMSDRALHIILNRSVQAIQIKRYRLMKEV